MSGVLIGAALSGGLPIALEAIQRALGNSASPQAQAVVHAAGQLGEAIVRGEVPREEVERIESDLAEIMALENSRLADVNTTMRAEASTGDPWVRRWRPFFGYVVAIAWLVNTIGTMGVMLIAPQEAAALLVAYGDAMVTQWSIALAVLGVSIHARTREKITLAGVVADEGPGVVQRVIGAIRPGR